MKRIFEPWSYVTTVAGTGILLYSFKNDAFGAIESGDYTPYIFVAYGLAFLVTGLAGIITGAILVSRKKEIHYCFDCGLMP